MKYSTSVKQTSKCMERLDVAKMPYLERLHYKRYGRRALQFAWKHEFDELPNDYWEFDDETCQDIYNTYWEAYL